jgi:hypothetical protein
VVAVTTKVTAGLGMALVLTAWLAYKIIGGLQEELGRAREECNTAVVEGARRASEEARRVEKEAADAAIRALKNELEKNKKMNEDLEARLRQRDVDLRRTKESLREAINASGDLCVRVNVPADIWMHTYGVRGSSSAGRD